MFYWVRSSYFSLDSSWALLVNYLQLKGQAVQINLVQRHFNNRKILFRIEHCEVYSLKCQFYFGK